MPEQVSQKDKQVTPQKTPTPPPQKDVVPKQSKPEPKKTPASEKDDRFKYEMTYVNGGFNNGAEVKPDKDGKANVEITIYGGGQKKSLTVSPLPDNIQKLVKAYEISATQNDDTAEVTQELQTYFAKVKTLLNAKIIMILKQTDADIANAVKETFSQIKREQEVS